jgi:poly(A) polymerase
MNYFNVSPSKMVGEIKDEIKEAILEGKIGNDYSEKHTSTMQEIGAVKGLKS